MLARARWSATALLTLVEVNIFRGCSREITKRWDLMKPSNSMHVKGHRKPLVSALSWVRTGIINLWRHFSSVRTTTMQSHKAPVGDHAEDFCCVCCVLRPAY